MSRDVLPAGARLDALELLWPGQLRLMLRDVPDPQQAARALSATLVFGAGAEHTWRVELPLQLEAPSQPGTVCLHGHWAAQAAPLRQIELHGGLDVTVAPALAASMARLHADDDAAYDAMFLEKRHRWGSAATQFFLAQQNARHFGGSPAYRCASAVICGYKAVEMAHPGCLDEAATLLDLAVSGLDVLPPHRHPRRNPEHLRVSLLTTRWHVDLARDRRAEGLMTLERVVQALDRVTVWSTPAYPGGRSLVLQGWLKYCGGDIDGARAAWTRAVSLFDLAVRDAHPDRGVVYAELRDVQDSAVLAARGLKSLTAQGPTAPRLSTIAVFLRVSRVGGAAAERLFDHLCRWTDTR
ncbi:MAG: hypothetical protein J0M20_04775 [Burkholderiales bacterium]|nr:hypothetical protein [Burkholderiales bacterium]